MNHECPRCVFYVQGYIHPDYVCPNDGERLILRVRPLWRRILRWPMMVRRYWRIPGVSLAWSVRLATRTLCG